MTDRTAGSVHLVADDPSEADTDDTPDTERPTGKNDAKAAEVTTDTVAAQPGSDDKDATDTADSGRSAVGRSDDTDEDDAAPVADAAAEPSADAGPDDTDDAATESAAAEPAAPVGRSVADVARGTRLADRYRLEDMLSSNGKSATWRAVDEKLRRAVGVHLVPAGSEHARSVMAAARAAALIGDPRFVQVLDAAEEDGLVYVVKEWLPDADNLATLLTTNPLPPHEAYEMVRSVADAMAVAHRAGLSHLRLDPDNVLRMHTGQYKIVGLSVEAALYGHDTNDAARDDTRAIGSLLYACLARRWPGKDAYGLTEAPRTSGRLCTPGQVKANVHGPLEAVAMRALGHEYKHQKPFETPEDVVAAMAAIPAVLPPEPEVPVSAAGAAFDDEFTPTALLPRNGFVGGPPPAVRRPAPAGPPPALGGGFGRVVKTLVALLVLVAVVLATWQIAQLANNGKDESPKDAAPSSGNSAGSQSPSPLTPPKPIAIQSGQELNVGKGGVGSAPATAEKDVVKTFDGNPATYWKTSYYSDGPEITYNRDGLGLVYDLGSEQSLRTAHIQLGAGANHTTVKLLAAPAGAGSMPTSLKGLTELEQQSTSEAQLDYTFAQPVTTRYVVVWISAMPYLTPSQIPGATNSGYQNSINEVSFAG